MMKLFYNILGSFSPSVVMFEMMLLAILTI